MWQPAWVTFCHDVSRNNQFIIWNVIFLHVHLVNIPELYHLKGPSQNSPLGASIQQQQQQSQQQQQQQLQQISGQQTTEEDNQRRGSGLLDATTHELKLDKSNIILLGPTGSGKIIDILKKNEYSPLKTSRVNRTVGDTRTGPCNQKKSGSWGPVLLNSGSGREWGSILSVRVFFLWSGTKFL